MARNKEYPPPGPISPAEPRSTKKAAAVPDLMRGVKVRPGPIQTSGIARLRQVLNHSTDLTTDVLCQEASLEVERLRRDLATAEAELRKASDRTS